MLFDNIWFTPAVWVGMAFAASLISIRTGISVALVEIFFGIGAGNLGVHGTTEWIDFLAMLGSGVLTFLAGAEIDPVSLKKHLKPSLTIGIVSFTVPFAAVKPRTRRSRTSSSAWGPLRSKPARYRVQTAWPSIISC